MKHHKARRKDDVRKREGCGVLYYRKTNNLRNIGVEQQKEMLKGPAIFSDNEVLEDYCDTAMSRGKGVHRLIKCFVISRIIKLQLLLFWTGWKMADKKWSS